MENNALLAVWGWQTIAISGQSRIDIWNQSLEILVKSWTAPANIDEIELNRDGEILVGVVGYDVRLWKSGTGEVLKNKLPIRGRTFDISMSSAKGVFATFGDDGGWVWSERTATPIQQLNPGVDVADNILGFLSNGMLAATRPGGSQIIVWEYFAQSRLGLLDARQRAVLPLDEEVESITDNGKHLVAVTKKGNVKSWRLGPAMLLQAHDKAAECLRSPVLSGDGRTIAAIGTFLPSESYIGSECMLGPRYDAVISGMPRPLPIKRTQSVKLWCFE